MRITSILILTLLLPIASYADMGTCFCFKAEIQTKEETRIGYFNILSYHLDIETRDQVTRYSHAKGWTKLPTNNFSYAKTVLKTDSVFANYVYSLIENSLNVYDDVLIINAGGFRDIKYLGETRTISKSDIESINPLEMYACPVGENIMTNLSAEDKTWMTESYQTILLGGEEFCDYTAVSFLDNPRTESKSLVREIKGIITQRREMYTGQKEYDREKVKELASDFKKYVRELKKHHIIVISSCSC